MCFSLKKESRQIEGTQTTAYTRLCPHRLTPHLQILAGAHNFPPHLSGVPPDPVPPLRLQTRCLSILRLLKRGGAGGSPRSFGHRPKPRSPSATIVASAALLASCCGARLGARGRPAEPTPSHSRALGRAPCFGLPTNAGGVSAGAQHMKPYRVANAPRYSRGRVLIFCAA